MILRGGVNEWSVLYKFITRFKYIHFDARVTQHWLDLGLIFLYLCYSTVHTSVQLCSHIRLGSVAAGKIG